MELLQVQKCNYINCINDSETFSDRNLLLCQDRALSMTEKDYIYDFFFKLEVESSPLVYFVKPLQYVHALSRYFALKWNKRKNRKSCFWSFLICLINLIKNSSESLSKSLLGIVHLRFPSRFPF